MDKKRIENIVIWILVAVILLLLGILAPFLLPGMPQ